MFDKEIVARPEVILVPSLGLFPLVCPIFRVHWKICCSFVLFDWRDELVKEGSPVVPLQQVENTSPTPINNSN